MARTSALRIRMDLALSADTSDMTGFAASVQKVEALKKAALDAGFVFTDEMTSRVGSFDFETGTEPQPEPATEAE